jgi:CBS domain-containing protein
MKLNELFTKRVVTGGPKDSLASVVRRMREHNVGTVVIVEGGKPVGMITDRDLALAFGGEGVSPDANAESVMIRDVKTIHQDAGVFSATRYMRDYEVRRLPIVDDDGNLVGIVSLDDLFRLLGREMTNLAEGIQWEVQVK